MDKFNPVDWFEIPVNNLDTAKKFYEEVFGLELSVHDMGPLKMAWFPMSMETYGAGGALVQHECYKPSNEGTLVYFGVGDIDDTMAKIIAAGGKVILPRMSIGEYGFIAQFEDSEGNRVALHSMK